MRSTRREALRGSRWNFFFLSFLESNALEHQQKFCNGASVDLWQWICLCRHVTVFSVTHCEIGVSLLLDNNSTKRTTFQTGTGGNARFWCFRWHGQISAERKTLKRNVTTAPVTRAPIEDVMNTQKSYNAMTKWTAYWTKLPLTSLLI